MPEKIRKPGVNGADSGPNIRVTKNSRKPGINGADTTSTPKTVAAARRATGAPTGRSGRNAALLPFLHELE
jgi:hypothetical protein